MAWVRGSHRGPKNRFRTSDGKALIDAVLAGRGKPDYPVALIAGTKGKGSTAAMLESIARNSGIRTGLFSSPPLGSYRNLVQVDRRKISVGDFCRLAREIKRLAAGSREIYAFEISLAIALLYFSERRIGLGVFEIGIGGRRDIVNLLPRSACAITSLGLDHTREIGPTLADIAREKAGIMRRGVPCVVTSQPPEAMREIKSEARETGAPLIPAEEFPVQPLHLRGRFQRRNAGVAGELALSLHHLGVPIDPARIVAGIHGAKLPCRLEVFEGRPPVVLDGAHNGDAANALASALAEEFHFRNLVLVFGMSGDKPAAEIAKPLLRQADRVLCTDCTHRRSLPATDLSDELANCIPAPGKTAIPGVGNALAEALRHANPEDLVCVTGSLFLAWEAREWLLQKRPRRN